MNSFVTAGQVLNHQTVEIRVAPLSRGSPGGGLHLAPRFSLRHKRRCLLGEVTESLVVR